MTVDYEPDYLEAFPSLEIVQIGRPGSLTRWITWRDEQREEIGEGKIMWNEWTLDFAYNFATLRFGDRNTSRRLIRANPVARGSHSFRFHALCRTCGKYVYRLFFRTSEWLCKDCQCLRNRSTFLSAQLRWQEEYDGLRYEIGEGRPPGMRELEFAKKRMRMTDLEPKLDGTRRRPGPAFFRLVFAEWSDRDPQS